MGRGQGTVEHAQAALRSRKVPASLVSKLLGDDLDLAEERIAWDPANIQTQDEPPVRLGPLDNEDVSSMLGRLRADLHELGGELLGELNGKLLTRDDEQELANALTECLNNDQFSRFEQIVAELREDHKLSDGLIARYDELLG